MKMDFINQYAKALFETAGNLKTQTTYLEELRVIDEAITKDNNSFEFLKSSEIPVETRVAAFGKALTSSGVSKDIVSTAKLLLERNKISYFSDVVIAFQNLTDEANGLVRGQVRSSHDLTSAQRKEIAEKIESVLKKKVILDYVQDSKVIGGLKAQVGSYTFDDTFETHLKKMKDQINRRTH